MKSLLLVLSCVFLSSCSTSDLESEKPIFSGHTMKTPESYNKCLAPKWVALKASSTSVPTENGYQISSSDDWMGAVSLVKIDKANDGGSHVSVYVLSKGWGDPWGSAAKECM